MTSSFGELSDKINAAVNRCSKYDYKIQGLIKKYDLDSTDRINSNRTRNQINYSGQRMPTLDSESDATVDNDVFDMYIKNRFSQTINKIDHGCLEGKYKYISDRKKPDPKCIDYISKKAQIWKELTEIRSMLGNYDNNMDNMKKNLLLNKSMQCQILGNKLKCQCCLGCKCQYYEKKPNDGKKSPDKNRSLSRSSSKGHSKHFHNEELTDWERTQYYKKLKNWIKINHDFFKDGWFSEDEIDKFSEFMNNVNLKKDTDCGDNTIEARKTEPKNKFENENDFLVTFHNKFNKL